MLKANLGRTQGQRRGVILIVVVAMLGLFATIGILAAVMSKVEGAGARSFKRMDQSPSLTGQTARQISTKGTFDGKSLLSEAMSQLIFDTTLNESAIRGHGMLRNMYGGPDAEQRPTPNSGYPYYGAFNGTGHFAPRDYPTFAPVAETYPGFAAGDMTSNVGAVNAAKTTYGLYRLRPPGDPARWPNLWNMPATALLEPRLPFNLVVMDAIGTRTSTPNVGGEVQRPERFYDGTNWHYFAKDVDYTAADHNNWFLALERGDGRIIQPSFHRPYLVAQLEAAQLFGDTDVTTNKAANNSTAWKAPEGRRVIFRPRAIDVSPEAVSGVGFQPPTNKVVGQPWTDLKSLDGSTYSAVVSGKSANVPVVGDSPEELDVDTDGDGLKDAIWVDLGLPKENWVRLPDGGLAKPLFAYKVISLDGKINLNTAGNYRTHLAQDGTSATTVPNLPRHASNLGASPAEINPKVAFLLDETTGTGNRIPDWNQPGFYANLLFGTVTNGTPIFGRWNNSGSTTEQPVVNPLTLSPLPAVIGPGQCNLNGVAAFNENTATINDNAALLTSIQLPWGAADLFGIGASYESFSAAPNLLSAAAYPTPYKEVSTLHLNAAAFGLRAQLPITTAAPGALTQAQVKFESATESVPHEEELLSDAAERASKRADTPFTAPQLERLLRYFDIDGSIQDGRLTQLLTQALDSRGAESLTTAAGYAERQYARQRMRRMFTHASWDLLNAGMSIAFPTNFAGNSKFPEDMSRQLQTPAAPYRHNGRFGVDNTVVMPVPLTTDFSTTLVTDAVNRGLGTNANYGAFGTRLPIEVRHGRRYNLNKQLKAYTNNDSEPDFQRTAMAEQIYVLLWFAVRPLDHYPNAASDPRYLALNRTLAQIAVNVVDYIDSDDVMTPMLYPDDPTMATNWGSLYTGTPDHAHMVFGFELPRLVLSEAVALVQKQTDMGGNVKHKGWAFAELHNPWRNDAPAATDSMAVSLNQLNVMTETSYAVRARFGGELAGTGVNQTVKFIDANPLKTNVGSKGSASGFRNYLAVGPDNAAMLSMEDPDWNDLLKSYDYSTAVLSNDMVFEQASNGSADLPQSAIVSLLRARNPYQPVTPATGNNPYVVIDSVCLQNSKGAADFRGLYEIAQKPDDPNVGTKIEDRHSLERKQPWRGQKRRYFDSSNATDAPFRLTSGDVPYRYNGGVPEELFWGLPFSGNSELSIVLDQAQETLAADQAFNDCTNSSAHTLGDENVRQADVYVSFPFANRPLASPFELLSLRLYGSHYWGKYSFETASEADSWRLRFFDDFQYYPAGYTTTALRRTWNSRAVPWFSDYELARVSGTGTKHPETDSSGNLNVGGTAVAMQTIPNLHRFFEFVECRSLLNGSLDPVADEAASSPFPKGLGNSSTPPIDQRRSRVAGKMCLNTISDEEAFRALLDAPEGMPSNIRAGGFDSQPDLPTPALHPLNYALDPFRRVYQGELLSSRWSLSGAPISFGGDPALNIVTGAPFSLARLQWGNSLTGGIPNTAVYPGRNSAELVSNEMFRMFLLSRAGRDGILGTGDDKPFRGFASDHLSDTLLRRRNFRALDYPQNRDIPAAVDSVTGDQQSEYLATLHGQYAPRLFDPIGNPFNRPNATGGAIDPVDLTQAQVDHKIELATNKLGLGNTFPGAANDQIDYWMLEGRRNKLLGKIAGNSTTRSNVFAVWVTVGLFRVQAGTESNKVPLLNEEVGSNTGEQVRHRGFFIVDRTRMDHYDASQIKSHSLDDDDMKKVIQHYTIIE